MSNIKINIIIHSTKYPNNNDNIIFFVTTLIKFQINK
jgi:hypothetical protein